MRLSAVAHHENVNRNSALLQEGDRAPTAQRLIVRMRRNHHRSITV